MNQTKKQEFSDQINEDCENQILNLKNLDSYLSITKQLSVIKLDQKNDSICEEINSLMEMPKQPLEKGVKKSMIEMDLRIQLKKEHSLNNPNEQQSYKLKKCHTLSISTRTVVTRCEALQFKRQIQTSFRKFDRVAKKLDKKFNKPIKKEDVFVFKPISLKPLKIKQIQSTLLQSTNQLDPFKNWMNRGQDFDVQETHYEAYEQIKEQKDEYSIGQIPELQIRQLPVVREDQGSQSDEFNKLTQLSDEGSSKHADLFDGQDNNSVFTYDSDKAQQFLSKKNKQEINRYEKDDTIQPYKRREFDHLLGKYKKTEYNAHRRHHHNIPMMEKVKLWMTKF